MGSSMDNLYKAAAGLSRIWHQMFLTVEPLVYEIIIYEIKNVNYIEQILDFCLDIPTDEGEILFYELCEYYLRIDKIKAMEYMRAYYENNCTSNLSFNMYCDIKR